MIPALTLSASPQIVEKQTESIIRKTIDVLINCESTYVFSIAEKLREIAARQYEINDQDQQSLEDVKLVAVDNYSNVGKVAANISAYVSAMPTHTTSSSLQTELKLAIYKAAKYSLTKIASLHEIVDIACALDHIDYAENRPRDEIFITLIDRLDEEIYHNQRRDVSLDIWAAFALRKVKVEKRSLYNQFCKKILRNMSFLKPLEISLVAKGFVQANYSHPTLFPDIKEEAIRKNGHFTVNEAVNTLWAYCYKGWSNNVDPSIMRRNNMRIVQAFKFKLIHDMGKLNVDQTVRIAWTFKNMNITDTAFFNAVRQKIDEGMSHLTSLGLVNITKLLCNIKGTDDSVLLKLLKEIEEKPMKDTSYFTSEELARITYAVLIKYCYKDKNFALYEGFIGRMLERMAAIERSNWDYQPLQLFRIIAILYTETSSNVDSHLRSHLKALIETIKPSKERTRMSNFHKDVRMHLDRLLAEFKEVPKGGDEYSLEDYFSLDIAFPDHHSVIEVDGDCHLDEVGNYMPKNMIKETFLKLRKWNLERILHAEWPGRDDYQSARYDQSKREFLLTKLSKFPWFNSLVLKKLEQ